MPLGQSCENSWSRDSSKNNVSCHRHNVASVAGSDVERRKGVLFWCDFSIRRHMYMCSGLHPLYDLVYIWYRYHRHPPYISRSYRKVQHIENAELGIVVVGAISSKTSESWESLSAHLPRHLHQAFPSQAQIGDLPVPCKPTAHDGVSNNLRNTSYMPNIMAALGTVRSK